MENGNSDMPCKIRKRRFPTASSSSSFANNNMSKLMVEITDSPRNEKCINVLDRSCCKEEESETIIRLLNSEDDNRANEVAEKSITNVDRSQNESRIPLGHVSAPQVINPDHRHPSNLLKKDKGFEGMHLIYDAKLFEEKSRQCGDTITKIKNRQHSKPKPTDGLDEIKHSLTISKQLLKLLTHIWTADTNHDHHPTTMSLATTLNHELNKARSNVNKLIHEQQSNATTECESKEQDRVRVAVKTISQELETERKLRRQSERMNKKLGRELANTKSSLSKAVEKIELEKQAMEILEQLCDRMAHDIEEDRVELEELKKESEIARKEMEEEREMLRVADMLREERVHMKLTDAKYEYEEKHAQVNVLVGDLEELLEADNSIPRLNRTPVVLNDENALGEKTRGLSWYKDEENENDTVLHDEKVLGEESRVFSWYENDNGEMANDKNAFRDVMAKTRNDIKGCYNSDCIEWEFGLDMRNESEDLNDRSEERLLGFSCSTMKEYEDEMERYKMIKDLRDRIVSGSELSRDTHELGSYM